MKSRILVFVQFSTILLMLLPLGERTESLYSGLLIITVGIVIGLLAIQKNKLDNFNIRPDIKEDCLFIQDGIYAYIRHPMYSSVLISMFGVLILYANLYELVLYILLFINMFIKMFYEESLWHCEGTQYKEYSEKTYRLIPYIF